MSDPNEEVPIPADAPEATAEDVVPVKVCPNCSVQTQTAGEFCPNCGKPYAKRPRNTRALKITAVVVGALIILGGGFTVTSFVIQHNHQVAVAHQAEVAAKAKAKAAAAAAEAQKVADSEKRAARASDVTQMEASITKDAQTSVASGILTGPITKTECTPLGGGSTDDLTATTTTNSCIAVNSTAADGTESGYAYSATMDWTSNQYSWHLGNQ
jgi:predicted nucleic acid-binding Zn ribbon protein